MRKLSLWLADYKLNYLWADGEFIILELYFENSTV